MEQHKEARRLVGSIKTDIRDLLMNVYLCEPSNPMADKNVILLVAEEVRRKVNVLYAFIRSG
jgi:hypothetical protein